MSQLVEFYRGTANDSEGRSLSDLWSLSDSRMESRHDFIQWMFPLEEPSQFNLNAPILTLADIKAFHDDPALRDNLLRSFDRFLAFLGLRREGDQVVPASDFQAKRDVFTVPNHNWLRITRVLTSLRLLGLANYSEAFYQALGDLIERRQAQVTAVTRAYWKNATFPDRPR
jgi:Opioid growth factor receptor (OGFr) conserved region